MIIQGSIFGAISDPNQWKQFSCIKEDGTLDRRKYAEYMQLFANQGANSTREIPFLVTDKNYGAGPRQRNFLPAVWRDNKYDWDQPNPIYYDNLKEMIKSANRHNMSFQISIFDRCHSFKMPNSPWRLNHQGIHGYYDWNRYAREYVAKIIDTVKQAELELETENIPCRVLFELENEPLDPVFTTSAVGTLQMLLAAGYSKDRIEDGVNYYPGNNKIEYLTTNGKAELIRSHQFETLKKAKKKAGLYPGKDLRDKRRYFTTIHNFDDTPGLLDDLKVAIRHSRRFSISNDGVDGKHSSARWKELLVPLLSHSRRRSPNLKRWKFEHIYRGDLQGNSRMNDAIDGVEGISQAYIEVTGMEPENYHRVPHVNYGPDTGVPGNTKVVIRGYLGILGRYPDPTGMRDYVKYLDEGGTILGFCERLVRSPEFKKYRSPLTSSDLAGQLYRGILERAPDAAGLEHSIREIVAGRISRRAAAMLDSEEFKNKVA